MGKEDIFISGFLDRAIGDDGAVIKSYVYSKDLFCEDIHFKRSWMNLVQIARKSMLVNISDALAMNAKPLYVLLGLVIPKDFSSYQLKELNAGFNAVALEHDVRIIGGDTTAGDKLMISVTVVSKSENALYRTGMKEGDIIAMTGNVGQSAKDLKALMRGGKVGPKSRFIAPKIRRDFIYKAAKYMHAGLDISDGLSKDLWRLCEASGKKGVKFYRKFSKAQLCSGEEYEMLFTFPVKNFLKIQRLAFKTRTPITIVGKAARKRYRNCCKENHF